MFNSGFTNKTAYKVIRPYTSQKLHFSSSLEGGASKCYREVKSFMPNSTDFSVMNMSTNELYDYKLNKTPAQQNGGILPSLDIKKLEDKMESLEKRLKTLEDKSINNDIQKSDKPILTDIKIDNKSEKLIQASPKINETNEIKSNGLRIDPGPTHNSDFAKAFL
jgi:hypothetical protein